MKALVIIPSIRVTENFGKYAENFTAYKHKPDIVIIDETMPPLVLTKQRQEVLKQLEAMSESESEINFFGIEARKEWFKEHDLGDVDALIPQRAHNELSFGLLFALTRAYDMICFVDDDTRPLEHVDFLGEHWKALSTQQTLFTSSCINSLWVNPIMGTGYFARGIPYSERRKLSSSIIHHHTLNVNNVVLHLGLWDGVLDLNAIDYLTAESVDEAETLSARNFCLRKNEFAPLSSMNLSFKPEVIPAFYQLWHNDRHDDIFSGIFLKHICDHMDKSVTFGAPLCYHDKAQRNFFDDIRKELSGMELNEELWRYVASIELTCKTWLECYKELATELYTRMRETRFNDYLWLMTRKMLLWCDVVEKLGAK